MRCPEFAARFEGFCRAFEEIGAMPDAALKADCENRDIHGYQAIESLLAEGREFDAVFAVTDVIAIGAMRALQENGFAVPNDVAVVGFDDVPLAAHVTPALTTVRQDIRQAAEGLVTSIVGLIEGKPVQSTLMAPRLIVRDSCGTHT